MFTKDALETLTQAEAISAANAALTQTVAPTNGEAAIALPESFKVHDLEHYLPTRRRLRGSMTTPVLADFAVYTIDHKEAGATVFVNPDAMKAVAVLNLGTPASPGHGDNRAVLAPPKTATFAALLSIANGGQRQPLRPDPDGPADAEHERHRRHTGHSRPASQTCHKSRRRLH